MAYKHLLVATDLSEECHRILERAFSLQKSFACELSLVHVVEPLTMAFGGDVPMDLTSLQQQQISQAENHLQQLSQHYQQIDLQRCHLRCGQAKQEIHHVAQEQKCDLIVVGSHGRHGLALLLGSTTSDLLSKAPCDVLAVVLKTDTP